MKRRAHGVVLLVVTLLAFSHYVLRGWERGGRRANPTPEFTGPVVAVIDGDTIDVMHDGQSERVRLDAVDCPERGQAFGARAKQFTSSLVFGQNVTVRSSGQDRYGRTIGDVLLPDGRSLNQELVKSGMAWWYGTHSDSKTLENLESEARSQRRGLWSDAHPTAPWEWRHRGGLAASPQQ